MSSQQRGIKRNHLREFLNESSIQGLRLLLFNTPFKFARLLWKILIAAIIIWTHYIIINLIFEYIDQPTEVRMSTRRVHISQSPFPAVSVCNGNKFSRAKLQKYAEEVFQQQQKYQPYYLASNPEEMAQHLLVFDGFYIFPYGESQADIEMLNKLDTILTFMYNTTQYPTRDILRLLSPDCEEIIIRGIIYGITVNVKDYWTKRMTTTGVCCMFNYKRASYALDSNVRDMDNRFIKPEDSVQFQANSILNSVQFVLQSNSDDFTISDLNIDAFLVSLFPPDDYAAIQSRHSGNIIVNYNSIVEIPVQPEFYESSYRVRQFHPNVRKCYFPDEGQKLLNTSFYSMNECLMKCRMTSMLKHCGCCTPPMMATYENLTVCSLPDLICLREWNAVWYGWEYFSYVIEADNKMMSSLTTEQKCPVCLPNCNGVKFWIFHNPITLRPVPSGKYYSHGLLKGLDNSKPLAIIKLFFKQRFAQCTITDVVADWVVHLNRFGGIMGLMYGFSIISCIEIVYFATGKFFVLRTINWRVQFKRIISRIATAIGITTHNELAEEPPPGYSLYWGELMPKPRVDVSLKYAMQVKH